MNQTTILTEINSLKTPAKQFLLNFYNALADMIEIPNSLLPERLHGKTGR